MAPKYKLIYFDIMYDVEPVRLIFAAANVEYEDVRIGEEGWPTLKPKLPWGQLPILEFDGVTLAQSVAIARYLSRQFGLTGENEVEAAKCDEYVLVVQDMKKEIEKFVHPHDENEKPAIKKKLEEEIMPRCLKKFTEILEKQGNGHLVGKKLTIADIYLADFCQVFTHRLGPFLIDNHSEIKAFADGIMNQPGIKEWIEKRPKTPF